MAKRFADIVDDSGFSDGAAALRETRKAGDFYWDLRDGKRELLIAIPWPHSDRTLWCPWPIKPASTPGGQSWEWDGNEDAPTLNPSLNWVGVWHGYMRSGELETV